ncbi:MAG: type II toxin-antitoxin system Phd/YefM family antitoxin [Candidatus Obscuribacterales bacterium]|nr:type II toxin-antitoxin system Phd/YefM family antitoxin [Candidatus Obscuribacterales bacterium]
MDQINIHQAKTNLSRLVERVLNGEEIVISRSGKPVAKLVPFTKRTTVRKLGLMKGRIRMKPDFDAPLPEEFLDAFEGA